jgi:hypothetical protein
MEKSKGLSIVLLIPTVVIGVALVKAFDFENLRFEKPALALVYFVGLALSIAFQWNALRKTR